MCRLRFSITARVRRVRAVGEADLLEADVAARDLERPRIGPVDDRRAQRASVLMPSCTVPICSNSEAISHMTQCEMPLSRSAMAVAAATAPTPTWP